MKEMLYKMIKFVCSQLKPMWVCLFYIFKQHRTLLGSGSKAGHRANLVKHTNIRTITTVPQIEKQAGKWILFVSRQKRDPNVRGGNGKHVGYTCHGRRQVTGD